MSVVLDGLALAVPFVPGGVGLASKAAKATKTADKVNDAKKTSDGMLIMNLQLFDRAKNKLKPNPKAKGGLDLLKRYDGKGAPHTNKLTGEDLMPHVHDKNVRGDVRKPEIGEIPKKPIIK